LHAPVMGARLPASQGGIVAMTYVVKEECINCLHGVDCFYVGENMLVINPDECIDCGVCEPECPVSAIVPDSDPTAGPWLEVNRKYSEIWPNITAKNASMPLPDAEKMRGETESPGRGISVSPGHVLCHPGESRGRGIGY